MPSDTLTQAAASARSDLFSALIRAVARQYQPGSAEMRLATLLGSIENARERLAAATRQGVRDIPFATMVAEELGKIVLAKDAYDAALVREAGL